MKKTFTFLALFLFITSQSFAQIEVIDKIAGTLLPVVTSGIKDIIQTSKEGGSKKEKLENLAEIESNSEKLQKDIADLKKQMSESITNDMNNIKSLNSIYGTSISIYDDLAQMEALTNPEIISALVNSPKDSILVPYGRQLAIAWEQVKDKFENLTTQVSDGSEYIQGQLNMELQKIDPLVVNIKGQMNFYGKYEYSKPSQYYINYLNNAKSANKSIGALKSRLGNVNSLLNINLASYSRSTKTLLESLD